MKLSVKKRSRFIRSSAWWNATILMGMTLLLLSCQESDDGKLFTALSSRMTGIDFRNQIREDENFNIFKYQYYYNGGGVAIGDFNNDDLQDIVFTGNMVKNRLYLNQGDFRFEDITKKSGIAAAEGWCTGVVPVDINEDGWLDLYICRAGYPFKKLRRNLLYINNGDLTFTERAKDYGLDDPAHATQASFFDYDKDGDLDLFLMNHSTVEYSRGSLEVVQLRKKKAPDDTNKLFRNDGGTFVNVTEAAGITSNVLTFSLGVVVADINNDSWPDLFVANDFNEPDYLFINQQDGTFSDQLTTYFDHTSLFSMGVDAADINNDGWLDLVSLDMLPESNYLQKMHSGADNFTKVKMLIENGFFKQYSRNMLQLNNGDGTFSEIGQLAGVSNTDWSWSALFFDFENDGNKDLFISNGYLRDHTDMDFLQYTADEVLKINKGEEHVDFEGYLAAMPPILQANYFYQNQGQMTFADQTATWSPGKAQVTQGAAYVDFDNDGDLDMVWNNSGETATILKNNADRLFQHNYLKVRLKGGKGNPQGIGAKVKITVGDNNYYQEQNPIRGFQTSVDPVLNFGLGKENLIDSLVVEWPLGNKQVLKNVKVNQTLTLEDSPASRKVTATAQPSIYFKKFPSQALNFVHQENVGNDLKQQFLLPYFYSRQGPGVAVGDVDGDGKEDLVLGNAQGQQRKLFLQKASYTFQEKNSPAFAQDAASEDVALHLFDADADGDLDLYAVSGGYHWAPGDPGTEDCLYRNDGRGNFTKQNTLPPTRKPHSCVTSADVDQDGDLDLFVGGAVLPNNYPLSAPSHVLLNDGRGKFVKDSTQTFDFPGIVSSAQWINLNDDAYPDLVVVGEWMPIQFYENQKGKLIKVEASAFRESGLWNTIHLADFDQDNDLDLVVGNFGYNSQWSASPSEPLQLYYGDFDGNRSVDPILCYYVDGKSYPFVSREDLTNQMPPIKRNFNYFKDYANAQITDILNPEQLAAADQLAVESLETVYLENQAGTFVKKALPIEAMIAPVHAIESMDVNGDGHLDMILAGNISQARVKLGKLDGNHGLILLGDGQGHFTKLPDAETGILVKGDVRNMFKLKQEHWLLGFGVNDEACQIYELQAQN